MASEYTSNSILSSPLINKVLFLSEKYVWVNECLNLAINLHIGSYQDSAMLWARYSY